MIRDFSAFGATVAPKRSFVPAIAGAGVGFVVGGPLGAGVGGVVGYFLGAPKGVPARKAVAPPIAVPPPEPLPPPPRVEVIEQAITRLENQPITVDQDWGITSGGGVGSGGARLQVQGYDLADFALASARAKTRRRGGY